MMVLLANLPTLKFKIFVEFFQSWCEMTQFIQSVNNVTESILNFLKFGNTGYVDATL